MTSLEELFPPYRLRLTCGDVELRVLRDDDIPELVDLVRGGIANPALPPPFLRAWYSGPEDVGGPSGFPTASVRWWFTQRGMSEPDKWSLALCVRHDGELVGMQDLNADHFPVARSLTTGSWLGLAHQGRGIGTLMRQMVVGLAFDELDALECHSGYVDGNAASAAVSRKTGYVDNGVRRIVQDGTGGVLERRVRVTPETYRRPSAQVTVTGAPELRRFLGVPRPGEVEPSAG